MNQNPKVINKIMEHYHEQFSLSILYDYFSTLVNDRGYTNFSKYIFNLSNDKIHTHREIFLNFFSKTGIVISGQPKLYEFPSEKIGTVEEIAKIIYNFEFNIRERINEIVDLCLEEKDYEDFNFLQWYVADGLKDFDEIDQIVKILSFKGNPITEDLAIAKYLKLDSQEKCKK